ncbi:MAG: hypothetical protein LUF30_10455 [Lachnospiraceae bacterium]|nr:hypothetical protein [Lachnospiraceae bacterium]
MQNAESWPLLEHLVTGDIRRNRYAMRRSYERPDNRKPEESYCLRLLQCTVTESSCEGNKRLRQKSGSQSESF